MNNRMLKTCWNKTHGQARVKNDLNTWANTVKGIFIIWEGTALFSSLGSSDDTGRKWSKRAEGLAPK